VKNKYEKKPWLYFWHPYSGLVGGVISGILVVIIGFILLYIIKI